MTARTASSTRSFQPLDNPTRRFTGKVFRYGDDVNTDVIFPGKYTYTLSTPDEVAPHALEDLDPTFVDRVETGDVIVAGSNFGCGSSREQAVTCLRAVGIGAVVARGFGRIFYRNALNQGLLALELPEAVDSLRDNDEVTVDLAAGTLTVEGPSVRCFTLPPFSTSILAMLEAGGLIAATRRRLEAASADMGEAE